MLVSYVLNPSDTYVNILEVFLDAKGAEEMLLTETEEQGVHTHGIHTEESMGDEIRANHHSLVRKGTIHIFQTKCTYTPLHG